MRATLLLLQDAVYLPSFGGGNKANRLLLAALATRGFDCHAVSRIPRERAILAGQFGAAGLAARGVVVDHRVEPAGPLSYRHQGVQVDAFDLEAGDAAGRIEALIRRVDPEWILVSDDRPALLLESALHCAPDRVVMLVHTHFHLPFGPEAERPDPAQHARMKRARGIVAVSEYSRAYLRDFGGLESTLLHFPVFDAGPFDPPAEHGSGHVLMINPCLLKGLPIFLALAALFPATSFAAVPTWGADAAVIEQLSQMPNITLLPPADEIGTVLRHARILLAPSLIPETFGYVAVDAMLRGIPVLAGNLGGQPEAKLGVDHVLPVTPARRTRQGPVAPPQDIAPWRAALESLLSDPRAYERCSQASRAAAARFQPQTDAGHFVRYLERLVSPAIPPPDRSPALPR